MRKAVQWLDSVQQGSGGFGEDIASYHETTMRGRGAATASQTAWALLGYVAAGRGAEPLGEESRRLSLRGTTGKRRLE